MRRFILPLVLLTSSAHFAFGQECDKAKLRSSIAFPLIHTSECNFSSVDCDDLGNPIDLALEITKESRRLTGEVADAEVYCKLAGYYARQKDEKKQDEAYQKAQVLLTPYLNTTDKNQARLLVAYCDLANQHCALSDEQWENAANRAMRLAPDRFDVWITMGRLNLARACQTVLGNERFASNTRLLRAFALLSANAVSAVAMEKSEKFLDEGRRCINRAKELAPTNLECRLPVVGYLYEELALRSAFYMVCNKKTLEETGPLLSEDVQAEICVVADLQPGNLVYQVMAVNLDVGRLQGVVGRQSIPTTKTASDPVLKKKHLGSIRRVSCEY